ncbi:MAG: CDP-alcohol phosphatidyltransferase family protein [Rhodospirillales bacterium]
MTASDLRLVLPNLITLARLCAVPVTIYLIITGHMGWAFWLFVCAGISDAVDGFLAKHFRAHSVIGGYLDPLADKALLVSVYVTLGLQGYLPAWLVILVVFRDALIVLGIALSHALGQPLHMKPLMVSKINTGLQITLAAAALLLHGHGIDDRRLLPVLTALVAASTLVSGAAYVVRGLKGAARIEGASQ